MIIPKISNQTKYSEKESSFNPLITDCPPSNNIKSADIAVVGDFPNDVEIVKQELFTGPSGSQFNRICAACRLARYQIYMTTACKTKPPGGNSDKLWTIKGWRHPDWGKLQQDLIDELSEFPGKVILLLGNTPMRLLIDEPRFNSIAKYRGSFFRAEEFVHLKDKLAGKIIGLSYHPEFTLYSGNPIHFYTIIADITKALRILEDPTLLNNNTKIIVKPLIHDIRAMYAAVKHSEYVAFDIEATPEFITCFSLAIYDKHEDLNIIRSMSIPLMDNSGNYWSLEQEVEIWIGLAEILNSPDIKKICQNGMFDLMFILRTMSIKTDNFYFDTMLAQHICYTELPKGLDYLTSIYTYYPYYKDEGKQAHLKVIKDWNQYWYYNAKDSAYLLPIYERLAEELAEFDCNDAMEYTMNLHKPLMEMEFNGLLTDQIGILQTKKKFENRINALQHGLNKLAGREINVGSSKQMIAYFYGICMIKPYVNRKTGNISCDTIALHRIAKKKIKGSWEAKLILKMRKYKKLVSTYFTIITDADNKIRSSYKITGTVSGRLSTEKTFFGTGANLQQMTYEIKKHIIPDPDWFLCEVDLAKAEAHVVAFLSQDVNMIEAFESGVDVHSFNASKIFNIPIEDVIYEAKNKKGSGHTMRDMGKRVVHASNYNMGSQTFSDNLATEDIVMSISECKQLLQNYSDRFPGLKRWHRSIEEEVMATRILYNLFNRPRKFLGEMNPALFRNAYSYKPQSTVAELLNRGLIKCANDPRLDKNNYDIRFNTTVHDSAVFSFHKNQIPNLLSILLIIKDHMTHTFTYKGKSFTIGLDAKIGKSWAGKTAEISQFTQEAVDNAFIKLGV